MYPKIKVRDLCAVFGVTKQAYYSLRQDQNKTSIASMIVLTLVKEERVDIPRIGGRKLFHKLSPELEKHQIKMGRDHFFDLLRFHGLLIRKRKRMVKTTDSFHWFRKYANLVEDIEIDGPEQLWVSDITYITTVQGFSYLSLITDAYSRKIVGYALHPTLEASGCMKALEMAIGSRHYLSKRRLIHHSDRGIQYCCHAYTDRLMEDHIAISMTQSGDPYENALAERMNNTIKNDYAPGKMYQSHNEASQAIDRIIESYNERRPHQSLNYMTPSQAHQLEGEIGKRWKKYSRKQKEKEVVMES